MPWPLVCVGEKECDRRADWVPFFPCRLVIQEGRGFAVTPMYARAIELRHFGKDVPYTVFGVLVMLCVG